MLKIQISEATWYVLVFHSFCWISLMERAKINFFQFGKDKTKMTSAFHSYNPKAFYLKRIFLYLLVWIWQFYRIRSKRWEKTCTWCGQILCPASKPLDNTDEKMFIYLLSPFVVKHHRFICSWLDGFRAGLSQRCFCSCRKLSPPLRQQMSHQVIMHNKTQSWQGIWILFWSLRFCADDSDFLVPSSV